MSRFLSSTLSIILAFVIAVIILIMAGLFPLDFFAALIQSTTGFNIITGSTNFYHVGEMLAYAVPIILTALAVGFAFKTGLFNIGAEGQFIIGTFIAGVLGLKLSLPPVIAPIVIIFLAGLGGAIWGAIPGLLKAVRNVHEVVVCIMMNYIALYSTNALLRSMDSFTNDKIDPIQSNASISSDFLSDLTNNSRLNWGIIIAIVALIVYYIVINKTSLGYRLKVIGYNKDAAQYAGINVKKGMVQSMAISGFFAGMGGAILILGIFGQGRAMASFENYGFTGLSVALVGGSTAIGIFFSGILFGILNASKPAMSINNIPNEIVTLVQGVIIYFISLSLVTDDKLNRFKFMKKQREEKEEVKEEIIEEESE